MFRYIKKNFMVSLLLLVSAAYVSATEIAGFDEYGFYDDKGNYIEEYNVDDYMKEQFNDFDSSQASNQSDIDKYMTDKFGDYSPEQDYLTGDPKLACEAILCLSSSTRPSECSPALKRYFSIKKLKWSDTVKARLKFLQLCPTNSDDPALASLLTALSKIGDGCDAETLNNTGQWIVETTELGNCYGAKDIRGVAEGTGKAYSITYKEKQDGGCTKTLSYWQVVTQPPSGCAGLWNHAYTYYEDIPKLINGINPWDTHWIE